MPTTKKPITFAPDDEIRKWYDTLEPGRRTKILNDILKCYTVVKLKEKEIYGYQAVNGKQQ